MPFDTPLAQEIWDKKYRFRSEAGEDADLAATLDRVANAVAGAEKPTARKLWRGRFRAALDDFRFIPAGRILAGAGTARSTFRDWAGEATSHPVHVAEMALAHVVANKTEAAYARGDLFEKRRALMADWAAYCTKEPAAVHRLHPAAGEAEARA